MFEVKITAQTAEELAEKLRALAQAFDGALPEGLSKPAPQPEPEQPPAPATSPIKLEDIRPLLVQLNQQQGREVTKELFAKFGADRLSGVDPSHYPELLSNVRFMLEIPF